MTSTDEFGKHEVIHTSSIIMEMFEEYICDHDAVKENAEVDEAADKVFSALFDFYQLVGATWLGGGIDND